MYRHLSWLMEDFSCSLKGCASCYQLVNRMKCKSTKLWALPCMLSQVTLKEQSTRDHIKENVTGCTASHLFFLKKGDQCKIKMFTGKKQICRIPIENGMANPNLRNPICLHKVFEHRARFM